MGRVVNKSEVKVMLTLFLHYVEKHIHTKNYLAFVLLMRISWHQDITDTILNSVHQSVNTFAWRF